MLTSHPHNPSHTLFSAKPRGLACALLQGYQNPGFGSRYAHQGKLTWVNDTLTADFLAVTPLLRIWASGRMVVVP